MNEIGMNAGKTVHRQPAMESVDLTDPADRLPHPADDAESDVLLVRRLLARDNLAWQDFVDQYQRLVLHTIQRTSRRSSRSAEAHVAEEIASDVIAELMNHEMQTLRSFSGRSRLSTWLVVIVRRVTLRCLERRNAEAPVAGQDSISQVASPAEEISAENRRRQHEALEECLSRLTEPDRLALQLHYHQGLSYEQMAPLLNISVNAVGPRLHRARRRLQLRMERHQRDPPDD